MFGLCQHLMKDIDISFTYCTLIIILEIYSHNIRIEIKENSIWQALISKEIYQIVQCQKLCKLKRHWVINNLKLIACVPTS